MLWIELAMTMIFGDEVERYGRQHALEGLAC